MQAALSLLVKYNPFISLFLLVIVIIFFIFVLLLRKEIKKIQQKNAAFFSNTNIKNFEDVILNHSKSLKILDKDIQELYNISNQINILAHKGLHKFAMIRFNPFKEVGGDQSFAIALLNGKNNGLVISSLYTREGTRIYAKAIVNKLSEKYPLTEEEKEVIQLANSNDNKKIN